MNYKIHELKLFKEYYTPLVNGSKVFEVRDNHDKDFKERDIVVFRAVEEYSDYQTDTLKTKYLPESSYPPYTAEIGFITAFKQQHGYVVFSLLNIKKLS